MTFVVEERAEVTIFYGGYGGPPPSKILESISSQIDSDVI